MLPWINGTGVGKLTFHFMSLVLHEIFSHFAHIAYT